MISGCRCLPSRVGDVLRLAVVIVTPQVPSLGELRTDLSRLNAADTRLFTSGTGRNNEVSSFFKPLHDEWRVPEAC